MRTRENRGRTWRAEGKNEGGGRRMFLNEQEFWEGIGEQEEEEYEIREICKWERYIDGKNI